MLFNFELFAVDEIEPWGEAEGRSLSWFALSLGSFWMEVGAERLFQYTDEITKHFGAESRQADYQVAQFARDMFAASSAGLIELSPFIAKATVDWDHLMVVYSRSQEMHEGDQLDSDLFYTAWRWLGERSPDTGYLRQSPRLYFLRRGNEVFVQYDNRGLQIDGISVWSAQYGVFPLSTDGFESEILSFQSRLMTEMDRRLNRIEHGTELPKCSVDMSDLRRQQQKWTKEYESYRQLFVPDYSWTATEKALAEVLDICSEFL